MMRFTDQWVFNIVFYSDCKYQAVVGITANNQPFLVISPLRLWG